MGTIDGVGAIALTIPDRPSSTRDSGARPAGAERAQGSPASDGEGAPGGAGPPGGSMLKGCVWRLRSSLGVTSRPACAEGLNCRRDGRTNGAPAAGENCHRPRRDSDYLSVGEACRERSLRSRLAPRTASSCSCQTARIRQPLSALNYIGVIPVMALRAHRHAEIRHFVRSSTAIAYFTAD